MLNLTRKVPKKGDSYSTYGDRNALVLTMEDGTTIEICLKDRKGSEMRIGVEGPKSMTIIRKESITGKKGAAYEKFKANLEKG